MCFYLEKSQTWFLVEIELGQDFRITLNTCDTQEDGEYRPSPRLPDPTRNFFSEIKSRKALKPQEKLQFSPKMKEFMVQIFFLNYFFHFFLYII